MLGRKLNRITPLIGPSLSLLALLAGATFADPISVTTSSGVKATLYGFAQLDGSWEDHRSAPAPGNLALYAQSGKSARSGEWNITANNTRFGVNLSGPDSAPVVLGGKVEFDFYGGGSENNSTPRLRHGYGTVSLPGLGLSFLAGQTWDLVAPLAPPTVNAGILYAGGNLGSTRRPQLRVTEIVALPHAGKLEIAGAVARSIGTASPFNGTASTDGGHDADIPTFQGRTSVAFPLWVDKQSAILGISGHFGQEDVLLADTANYETLNSWSWAVDLELPVANFVSLAGEGFLGRNLDAYNGGIGQGFVKEGSGAKNVAGLGGWVALRFKFGSITANIGGGVDSVYSSTVSQGGRTRNTNAFGNVGYNLTQNAKVAFEVERIETDYKAAEYQRLWRIQSAYTYGF